MINDATVKEADGSIFILECSKYTTPDNNSSYDNTFK
jgi:hypothetical protein